MDAEPNLTDPKFLEHLAAENRSVESCDERVLRASYQRYLAQKRDRELFEPFMKDINNLMPGREISYGDIWSQNDGALSVVEHPEIAELALSHMFTPRDNYPVGHFNRLAGIVGYLREDSNSVQHFWNLIPDLLRRSLSDREGDEPSAKGRDAMLSALRQLGISVKRVETIEDILTDPRYGRSRVFIVNKVSPKTIAGKRLWTALVDDPDFGVEAHKKVRTVGDN